MRAVVRSFIAAFVVVWTGCAAGGQNPGVREPAVAGQFYPANPAHLKLAIDQFLKTAVSPLPGQKPVALVVPHAGYIYCGQILADAYRQVSGQAFDTIAILGPNHTVSGFAGISVYARGAFKTPLGEVPVDEEVAARLLAGDKDCTPGTQPHLREHSVEVQVPFVQTLFPKARIVPVVIGDQDPDRCARFGQALAKALEGRQALVVASSDLSHYPAYDDAVSWDRQTLEAVASMSPRKIEELTRALAAKRPANVETEACGEAPILAAMACAKSLGARRGVVVSYANSGDALLGERDRVVGYGAVLFSAAEGEPDTHVLKPPPPAPAAGGSLPETDRKALLAFARECIQRYLTTQTMPLPRGFSPAVARLQGAFVTLKKHGDLRGCIGHIPAETPLVHTVGAMAAQAAFNDPRFPPLASGELAQIAIEISALTPPRQVRGPEEIVVGRDGVILSKDGKSAVFLPQVAPENNWSRDEMLDNLCMKAGLRPGSWKQGARFAIFQAEVFGETDHR
jgi:MEMO1 family protein